MDNKNPQIISSGARHSVQVGLDNKNAQTKRNLVKSDEAQAPEQVLANETQAERAAAQLSQGVQVETVRPNSAWPLTPTPAAD
jgi:hypothetical protein